MKKDIKVRDLVEIGVGFAAYVGAEVLLGEVAGAILPNYTKPIMKGCIKVGKMGLASAASGAAVTGFREMTDAVVELKEKVKEVLNREENKIETEAA